MIYTTGTVNTVSGSAIVKGTGTKFKNNNPAINIGMTILIKSGTTNIPYMIKSVNSDTELVLAQPALATATNTTFSIHITEPDNNSDAARTMVAINSYVEYFLDAMNTWMAQTGQTKIEMPNGEVVTLDSIKKMQEDISNRADLVSTETQRFKGQVTSFAGMYVVTDNTFKNYFGVMKPEEGHAFRLYGEVGGKGAGFTFPEASKADVVITESGNTPNLADNRLLFFKAKSVGKSSYFETMWTDGSYRWRIGSLDATSDFQITTSGGGSFKLTKDWCRINGKDIITGGIDLYAGSTTVSDFNYPKTSGFFGYTNRASNKPGGDTVAGYGKVITAMYDASNWTSLVMPNYASEYLSIHRRTNDVFSTVHVLTSNKYTIDSNGFIKRASPIIDINPDGTFTTNDESEGATVTRIAKGEYLIEGVLGFNADAGWGGVDGGIEIPLDVNKQPLVWVNSKVNKDGSILVKTYHRTHPSAPEFARNDIDGFNDGDPIDIPDGRFISVRVQMPEQSIYNVRMREMEEAQKAEEKRRQKEEEMKEQFGLDENDELL